jgi:hypothetical protein
MKILFYCSCYLYIINYEVYYVDYHNRKLIVRKLNIGGKKKPCELDIPF